MSSILLALSATVLGAPKVAPVQRITAKVIDLLLVMTVASILPAPLGALLGFIYSITADGLPFPKLQGQSIGKKAMGLRVMNTQTREPASLRDSLLRNTPVGVTTFFAMFPPWGWIIMGIIGPVLMVLEVYLIFSVQSGHRIGDVMGDTEVVEAKPRN